MLVRTAPGTQASELPQLASLSAQQFMLYFDWEGLSLLHSASAPCTHPHPGPHPSPAFLPFHSPFILPNLGCPSLITDFTTVTLQSQE